MHSLLGIGDGPWLELLLSLAVGPLVVAAVAALAARRLRAAVWQRTAWQAGVIALVLLLLAELSGAGPALVGLCQANRPTGDAPAAAIVSEDLDRAIVPAPPATEPTVGEHKFSTAEAAHPAPPVATRRATATDAREAALSRFQWHLAASPPGDSAGPRLSVGTEPAPSADDAVLPAVSEPVHVAAPRPGSVWPWWIAAVCWLAGSGLLFVRLARSAVLFARGRRRLAAVPDVALLGRIDRLALRLRLRHRVQVLEAAGLDAPAVAGVWRPTLVLPAGFAGQFTAAEQEAMLAHELAHLAARDPAWKLAVDLLAAALWWQPAVWWIRRQLWASSEAAADEASLLVPGGPDVLAGCLVTIGQRLASHRRLGWISVAGSGFRSSLGRRVQRLLNLSDRAWHLPCRGRMLAARTMVPLLLAAVAVLSTAWARPQANLSQGDSTMNVLSSSWRRSLAALTMAALLGPISGDVAAEDTAPTADQLAMFDGDREGGERAERDRPREGDREGGERAERERPREGDREHGERPDRDRPREGDREHAERAERDRPREGDREHAERERPREGDREHGERPERDGPREGDREARDRPPTDIEHLERRLQELRRAHQQANAAGRRDAAEKIEREGREVLQQLERIRARHREQPNRERMERRLEELKRAMHEAAEAGQRERAEQLEREAREIHRALEEGGPDRQPGPRNERERRMHHVRVAAENLRAAGFHEAAERLLHEAEEALSERPHSEHPRPEHPQAPGVGQLREEVEQLRHEMRELRTHLRELLEDDHEEGDDDADEDDDED